MAKRNSNFVTNPPSKKRNTNQSTPYFEILPKSYSYSNKPYICNKCLEEFLGNQAEIGRCVMKLNYFIICCPQCHKNIDAIPFPTLQEIVKFDPSQNRRREAEMQIKKNKTRQKEFLKDASQLVDIESNNITIKWHMDSFDDPYVFIKYKNVTLWKEPAYLGNQFDYMIVRSILEDKYGDRLKKIIFSEAAKECLYCA